MNVADETDSCLGIRSPAKPVDYNRHRHIEAKKQVGYSKCETVNGAAHTGGIVTMIQRKSNFYVPVKAIDEAPELVGKAIT